MPYDRSGAKNPRWKGGRRTRPDGYVDCWVQGHPYAYQNRVLEHRLVMEAFLGRYLRPNELVHHENEIRGDNRLENLKLTNRPDHSRHHSLGKKYPYRWKPRVTKKAIKILYLDRGLVLREVAEQLAISYGSLRCHCLKFGIPLRGTDLYWVRRGRMASGTSATSC